MGKRASPSGFGNGLLLAVGLLLATLCLVQRGTATQVLAEEVGVDYDYFVFSYTWPASFCNENRCVVQPDEWTIHGFRPNFANGSYPEKCDPQDRFDEKEVKDLVPQMQKIWPDLTSKSCFDWFWMDCWETYGTCAAPLIKDQHAYFSRGLFLGYQFNPNTTLNEDDIVPSNSKTYALDDVVFSLDFFYQGAYILRCSQNGEDVLYIDISIDKNFEIISGSGQTKGCKDQVRLPSFYDTQ